MSVKIWIIAVGIKSLILSVSKKFFKRLDYSDGGGRTSLLHILNKLNLNLFHTD